MEKYIYDESNGLWYERDGDYYIPCQKLPEIDIATDISFTQIESWVVRIDSPVLLDSLNSWLSRYKETLEFKNLIAKYY